MLKKLRRHARLMEIIIDGLPENESVIEVTCNTPEESGLSLTRALTNLYLNYGLHSDNSHNPSYYTIHQPNLATLDLNADIQKACMASSIYTLMDRDVSMMPLSVLWKTFIGTFASYLGHQVIFSSFSTADQKRLFIQLHQEKSHEFMELLHTVENSLHFSLPLSSRPVDVPNLKRSLRAQLDQAKEAYLNTDAEWTQEFYLRLGDDLSRAALLNFLRQRMFAKVFWHCDTYYTLTPPVESAAWRCRRMRETIVLPPLESPDPILPFLYLHTFIFEQYAIPGIIAAKPGDVVLDIGAGIGDTSVYFSRKIQESGHCFAFEPLDLNLNCLKNNITRNQCGNITPVPFALADKKGTGLLRQGETATTITSSLEDGKEGQAQCVRITTVDDFSADKHIDFIKADIEGAELNMLRGAHETLRRDKPVCALTLYHREDDFRTLPQYLESINPDYTFYIRCDAEPMLFAISSRSSRRGII